MGKFVPRSWRRSAMLAFVFALVCTISSGTLPAFAASLIKISSDPYTNPTSQHKTEVEPDNLAFGSTVVSAFQIGRYPDVNGGSTNIGWATSTDAGESWTHGFLPGITKTVSPANPYARVSDPAVAFDARHDVWLIVSLSILSSGISPSVIVNRSTNGGTSWSNPVIVNQAIDKEDFDKTWIVCDNTPTSPFYGHCYTEWDDDVHGDLIYMSTSTDGGLTWGPRKTTANRALGLGGQPLVQPRGTVVVPIDNSKVHVTSATAMLSFIPTDGGASWTKTFEVAKITRFDEEKMDLRNDGGLPSGEIDRTGKVYIVWSDCRFEPDCVANDIVMSTSTDGIHWTSPLRIPIDPIGSDVDHLILGLAVDRTTSDGNAHLGLTYYYLPTTHCTLTTCQLNVGFISSTNGGRNWSMHEQLAGPMMLTWLPTSDQGRMVGDYISTSIVPGKNYATPVFAVAFEPKGGAICGLGVVCNEAIYTTPKGLAPIVGGTNPSTDDRVVVFTQLSITSTLPRRA